MHTTRYPIASLANSRISVAILHSLATYRLPPPTSLPCSAANLLVTRTGTQRGVSSLLWLLETPRELAAWGRTLVQAAHSAVELVDDIVFGRWRCCVSSGERGERVLRALTVFGLVGDVDHLVFSDVGPGKRWLTFSRKLTEKSVE